MLKKRQWLPWELNWLRQWGMATNRENLEEYGEKPVEYLTGRADFRGESWRVNEKTLIPRLETEELVEKIVIEVERKWIEGVEEVSIWDVGTGSGVLGLSVAQNLMRKGGNGEWRMTLSDISEEALTVARINLAEKMSESNGWRIKDGQIRVIKSDLGKNMSQEEKYEVIVANLPYVPEWRREELDVSVIDFEPELALFGGEDGLEVVRRLLAQAPQFLADQGVMWLEVDETHDLEKFLTEFPIYKGEVFADQFEKSRFWRVESL